MVPLLWHSRLQNCSGCFQQQDVMDQLTYFRLFHNIPDRDYQLLQQCLNSRSFKKGEFITTPGQIQKELLFCETGVQMSYFETEEKTHVIAFTYPPNPCAIPES